MYARWIITYLLIYTEYVRTDTSILRENIAVNFIKDFLTRDVTLSKYFIVTHLDISKKQSINLCKQVQLVNRYCAVKTMSTKGRNQGALHLANLHNNSTKLMLNEQSCNMSSRSPSKWILFYYKSQAQQKIKNWKQDVDTILQNIFISVNMEVYVVLIDSDYFHVHLIYKIKPHLPFIWEEYAKWSKRGFDRPYPEQVLAMRRRNLRRERIVAVTVMLYDDTLALMPNYLRNARDTVSKLMYYMTVHLFEWVNGTGYVNRTDVGGRRLKDGRYSGVIGELAEGRADFSGTPLVPMKDRISLVNFVLSPAPVEAMFIFKKPSLASVANIYTMPFSFGVWLATILLIVLLSLSFILSYCIEEKKNNHYKIGLLSKLSEGFHESLCIMFQQGTASDPVSFASRQILLLGLLAFMFLYTAYSANVVALLQSTTNEINNVETLLQSPLQCGAENIEYIRHIFKTETRPIHRALVDRKITPFGDQVYAPIPEGIRKVREGMYAFHVLLSSGYDEIQKTFLDDEKCNLGRIKYMSLVYPYFGIAYKSPIKEQLRIGAFRIIESGVQDRSTRRVMVEAPQCAGAAMFAPVRLTDVTPTIQFILLLYTMALLIFGLELYSDRRSIRKRKQEVNENTHHN